MAITLFGTASTPSDNGTNTANPTVVTPPVSMVAGQLVYVVACGANTSGTVYAPGEYAGTSAGGQVWTAGAAQRNASRNRARCFSCVFNGTWDSNPSLYMPGTANNIVRMLVFSGSHGASTSWVVGKAESGDTYTAPTTPFTVSISGFTVGTKGELAIATWTSADDNTWGTIADPSGEGWAQAGSQVRNTSGTYDQSVANAWMITPHAGGMGGVSLNQATLGGDLGTRCSVTFREYNNISGSVLSQSGAVASGTVMLMPLASGSAISLSTAKARAGFSMLAAAGSASVSASTAAAINLDRIESFYNWLIGTPAIGGVAGPELVDDVRVTSVSSYVTSGTSATFNVEERTTPESAGTDILASDQAADADGTSTTTIDNAALVAGNTLFLDISATSGSPDILSVTVAYYKRIYRTVSAAGHAVATSSAVAKIGDILRTVKGAVASATLAFARATGTFLLAGSVAAASYASAGASGTALVTAAGSAASTSTAAGSACIANTAFGFYNWLVGSPAIGGVAGPSIVKEATILEVSSFVTAATSAAFNVEIRSTPETAGTDILASDQTADVDGTSTKTIATPALTTGYSLWLDISAVTGTPDILSVTVSFRYDITEQEKATGSSAGTSSATAKVSVLKPVRGSAAAVSTATASVGSTVENIVKFYNWLVQNPAVGLIAGPELVEGATIIEVSGYTTAETYVRFNLQERTTPNVATSALITADLQVGTTGSSTTAFDAATLGSGNILVLDIRAISGTPGILSVTVFYTTAQPVKGRSNGTSAATASATLYRSAKGSSGSIFATTGNFVRARFVTASAQSAGTAGAGAKVTIFLAGAGSSAGTSTAVASPTLIPLAFGSVAATSNATARASALWLARGSAASTSTAAIGGLGIVGARGHSTPTSTATAFADYKNRGFGHATATSTAKARGVLTTDGNLVGTSRGVSTARAKFTYTSGGFSGTSAGASTARASATRFGRAIMWFKVGGEWYATGSK